MKPYDSIGHRGYYILSNLLSEALYGVERTFRDELAKYDVVDADISLSPYKRQDRECVASISLKLKDEKDFVEFSFKMHVDESAVEDITKEEFMAYAGASPAEVKALFSRLEAGDSLSELEPELFDALAVLYAANSLPNTYDGGEWTKADEDHIVKLAGLSAKRKKA